jgi:isoleucyl-tRNA synthetase
VSDTERSTSFHKADSRVDINALEAGILELWEDIDAFHRSVEMRSAESEYTFYDGPPFPTGSPHYGNLLAGVIKDIVPRYWTMRGHRVERRFGWDTHGLPVEMEVEKDLGLSGPRQIGEYGIDKFNEACRVRVQANTENWEYITRRLGRWIDFENDYKTMDVDFMESVWWVVKTLWDKGLIYKDFKVLPYSWGATTTLSNFEANLDYRDVDDPAITVRLELVADRGPVVAGDYLLIWTTTPWTLPGNLAVAVGEDLLYSRVRGAVEGRDGVYWIADELREAVFAEDHEVLATVAGEALLGAEYRPPFDYFEEERDRGAFRVIASPDVNTDEGTGLVHMAPAYGEADFYALQSAGLDVLVDPIDAQARFTEAVPDVAGEYVKDADATLMRLLRESGLLLKQETIRHSYPYCWRTETPLIYKAIPTWFVRVESFRDRMVELNKKIHWVPEYVGSRRFGNWLEGARDWAISRNRYWGSCIPVWECDSCDESQCLGSRGELEQLSGVWLDDLHKHIVDDVTYPCSSCEGTMRRVPEVLDCWFESGSMPYAQLHYPFEQGERFERTFPADFIAEGLDQTRGWFYTLVVLGVALFDTEPFKNCVVNGMILSEDGRKMSKSLKNYPDPVEILDDFGADALRAYMINSPVLRAEPLLFSRDGVRDVVRTVLLPLWNAYSFFSTYAEADNIRLADLENAPAVEDRAEIDRWILSVLQSLVTTVNREMEQYRLYAVIPPILRFIDDLTNWYIRRSRRRFWSQRGIGDDTDKMAAFATLYEVLVGFSKVAAPVVPFMTEQIYQDLVKKVDAGAPDSVHHTDYPVADESVIDRDLEAAMEVVRNVVNMGRGLRKRNDLKVRQPLSRLTVVTRDAAVAAAVDSHRELIDEELNVRAVTLERDEGHLVELSARANFKVLGPRLGGRMRDVAEAISALSHGEVDRLLEGETLEVFGEPLAAPDIVVQRAPRPGVVVAADSLFSVALDTTLDAALLGEGLARELINRIQTLRRDGGLDVSDRIRVRWHGNDDVLRAALADHGDLVAREVLATSISESEAPLAHQVLVNDRELSLAIELD